MAIESSSRPYAAPHNAVPIHVVRSALLYEPLTGWLIWRTSKPGHRQAGRRAGTINAIGYRRAIVDGISLSESRVAWLLMTGSWPTLKIDHKNGDTVDNRWENLREASHLDNARNAALRSDSTVGMKGVHFHKKNKCWVAGIHLHGKRKHLGSFRSPEAASEAYAKAAVELFGEFVRVTAS